MIHRHTGAAAAHSKQQLPPGDIPRVNRVAGLSIWCVKEVSLWTKRKGKTVKTESGKLLNLLHVSAPKYHSTLFGIAGNLTRWKVSQQYTLCLLH